MNKKCRFFVVRFFLLMSSISYTCGPQYSRKSHTAILLKSHSEILDSWNDTYILPRINHHQRVRTVTIVSPSHWGWKHGVCEVWDFYPIIDHWYYIIYRRDSKGAFPSPLYHLLFSFSHWLVDNLYGLFYQVPWKHACYRPTQYQ